MDWEPFLALLSPFSFLPAVPPVFLGIVTTVMLTHKQGVVLGVTKDVWMQNRPTSCKHVDADHHRTIVSVSVWERGQR